MQQNDHHDQIIRNTMRLDSMDIKLRELKEAVLDHDQEDTIRFAKINEDLQLQRLSVVKVTTAGVVLVATIQFFGAVLSLWLSWHK